MSITIRELVTDDLAALIELDRRLTGSVRRDFHERRQLAAAEDPTGFIALAATDGPDLVGYASCHIQDGEFGAAGRVAVIDAIGIDPARRGGGLGRRLLAALEVAAVKRSVGELVSQADWSEQSMVRFFQSAGFELTPRLVLKRATTDGLDFDAPAPERAQGGEVNLSDPSGDDYAALSRDLIPVRSLAEADLPALVAIDRKVTGRDRAAYYRRKAAEVLRQSGVRVSLVAERDGQIAGFIMARTDFGGFGRVDATAMFDSIGVEPAFARHSVGRAMMSQLLTNLASLGVETVQTQVGWNEFGLLGFLARCGFTPAQRLSFSRRVG